MPLTDEQGEEIVLMARDVLERFTKKNDIEIPQKWDKNFLNDKRGVFVTLKKDDLLRGCIGFPYPIKSLGTAVIESTIHAAAHDPRFSRVNEDELPRIMVEVSVLSPPEQVRVSNPVHIPSMINIGVDGVIISANGTSGLLLPQVATESKLSPDEFLSEACIKAGLIPDSWLTNNVTVQKFQAEIFSEISPKGTVRRKTL
jgi:uncharacterized protein (TIGR00296 family)